MFFIYGTDAPIYHYPITTTVMLVLNVLIHFFVSISGYDVTPWILAFGDGFHPLQWVSHNFLHIGWLHLIGNMLFLFPFGLIVEGKIGWWRMLILYVAIGTFQGFTQQAIMLSHDPIDDAEALVDLFQDPDNPMDEETKEELTRQWRKDLMKEGFGSLGASAVIFGLLAVCAIWAPVNDFDVYFRWSPLISAPDGGQREWSVMTVCGIFVAKEFFMFLMMGMPISSEALHLNGFVVGAVFGLVTLYYGLVDCEGFDLISQWTGSPFVAERTKARERRERQLAAEAARPQGPPQAMVPKMAHQLASESTVPPASLSRFAAARETTTPNPPSASNTAGQVPSSAGKSPGVGSLGNNSGGDNSRGDNSCGGGATIPSRPVAGERAESPRPFERMPVASSHDSLFDASLPAFDEGVAPSDLLQVAKTEIETMVARGEFSTATRRLAELRQQEPGLVLSPAAMGRLAEGLIKQQHIQPALTVLQLGATAYPAYAARWRIRVAAIELSVHHDPIKAIKQLRLIDKETLDSQLREQFLKVADRAKRMAGHD